MRKKNSFLVIVFLLVLFFGYLAIIDIALASWGNMQTGNAFDNISDNNVSSGYHKFTLDSYGNPFIVWGDNASGNPDIYFRKWTAGTGWTKMDGTVGADNISNNASNCYQPNIVLNSLNIPYIAWLDSATGVYDIYFKKWTAGTGWTKMDGTSGFDNVSDTALSDGVPTIIVDSNNNPYIIWSKVMSMGTDIYFRKWTPGTGWTKMDGTAGTDNISNNDGSSSSEQIKLDSNNNPYIVWADNTSGTGQAYFKKWTPGTGWTKMDGTSGFDNVSNSGTGISYPRLLLDSSNIPFIIWKGSDAGNIEIYFSKWTPVIGWTKMDGTLGSDNVSNTNGTSDNERFKIDNFNIPYIVWQDATTGNSDIYFSKWTPGTGWSKMDGTLGYDNVSNSSTASYAPEIAVGSDSIPKIIWREDIGMSSEIYFRKWKVGTGWTKMGEASGTDNVSNNSGASSDGYILLNNVNYPNILWKDDDIGNDEIYFTRWVNDAENYVNISASVEASLTLSLPSAEINLGVFSSSNIATGIYTASISTNSGGGYAAYLRADGKLRNTSNDIDDVTGGAVADSTEAFGVSTTKASQAINRINDANSDTFYTAADCTTMNGNTIHANASAITTSDQQYASADGPVSGDETSLCFAAAIAGSSPAGVYTQITTLTVIGNY